MSQANAWRVTAMAATGEMARALAARLAVHGYRVWFSPGRDRAVFKMTGLRPKGA